MRQQRARIITGICSCIMLGIAASIHASDFQPSAPKPGQPTKQERLLKKLEHFGSQMASSNAPEHLGRLHLEQADVLEELVNSSRGKDRVTWMRQLADSLEVAGISSPSTWKSARDRLVRMKRYVDRYLSEDKICSYVTFRLMQVEHEALPVRTEQDIAKKQAHWEKRLAEFVDAYPHGEETPLILLELAKSHLARNHLEEAREWYARLAKDHPKHDLAEKALSLSRRLALEGKKLYLALPRLENMNDPFDIAQLRDKMVIVYFWSSVEPKCDQMRDSLKELMSEYKSKGVELVGVNVDETPEAGRRAMRVSYVPGMQVHQRGGIGGRLTEQYGVDRVPSMILLGKGGTVLHRNPSIETLKKELSTELEKSSK